MPPWDLGHLHTGLYAGRLEQEGIICTTITDNGSKIYFSRLDGLLQPQTHVRSCVPASNTGQKTGIANAQARINLSIPTIPTCSFWYLPHSVPQAKCPSILVVSTSLSLPPKSNISLKGHLLCIENVSLLRSFLSTLADKTLGGTVLVHELLLQQPFLAPLQSTWQPAGALRNVTGK